MIYLITGASHTGKTVLAQKLLEKYGYPYISIDHVKMGLIRSGYTTLTPYDDDKMTEYIWPVIREIIKTAIENGQNLIVEGCYVPAEWQNGFSKNYLKEIKFNCLVMTEKYIRTNFETIKANASAIEQRGDDADFDLQTAIDENKLFLKMFKNRKESVLTIEDDFGAFLENIIRTL